MTSKERREQKVIELIVEAGEEGLLQSELWKKLDLKSREGSRIAKKFEEKGSITRERVLSNGRWTYKLILNKVPVTLESIKECPCLICSDIDKCFRGGVKNPNICIELTAWIDPRIEQQALQPKEVEQ